MPYSIRGEPATLEDMSAWLADTSVVELAEELRRFDPEERAVAFRLLPRDRALAIFEALDGPHQQEILEDLRGDRYRHLVEDLEPDDRARLLGELPAKVVKRVLQGLSPAERSFTAELLGYAPESAGRVMTPEFVSLRASMTAAGALEKVRRSSAEEETLYVLPVTDNERHLVGSIDLPRLVRAGADDLVGSLMTADVASAQVSDDQETAARRIADGNLAALPVLDSEERLVGMITVDDAIRIIQEEETENLIRAGGSEPLRRPYFAMSPMQLARRRAVWLLVLAVGATLTVNVLGAFEDTVAAVVTLALFVPLLIGTGGNTGAQAATVVIRAMSLGDVRFSDLSKVLWREGRVGILLGGMLAAAAFVPVVIFFGSDMAIVISLTLVGVCTWATFAGAMMPMIADRIGIDPAVVSAPFITTLVDATGLIIYFMIARTVLGI